MAAINQNASQFLRSVAQQFDQRHFPKAESFPDFVPEKNVSSSGLYTDLLTKDLQGMFSSKAENFSNWLSATLFLDSPLEDVGRESVRRAGIELSAKTMLMRLNQPLGYFRPYSEQLFAYVFQEAFNRAEGDTRLDRREHMIDLAAKIQPGLDNLPFTFRRVKYKVEYVVARVLNHTLCKIALTYLAYRVGQWIQPQVYHLLSQTVIPRGVNFLINHAHLSVIRVVSGGVALVQAAYFHYWKTTAAFFAIKWAAGKIHPLAKRAVTVVETFAFFPSKMISYLVMSPFSLFTSSWEMNSSLAASLNSSYEKSKTELYREGGLKACRAWMEMMQPGIQADLLPQPLVSN